LRSGHNDRCFAYPVHFLLTVRGNAGSSQSENTRIPKLFKAGTLALSTISVNVAKGHGSVALGDQRGNHRRFELVQSKARQIGWRAFLAALVLEQQELFLLFLAG
ncbi:MAG TPA: hypothetical protein VMT82_01080, partial [candidate division Zixibacteria bacterium]|nr:hypothetical protein [candidate division Zixibacteria bacterium]